MLLVKFILNHKSEQRDNDCPNNLFGTAGFFLPLGSTLSGFHPAKHGNRT